MRHLLLIWIAFFFLCFMSAAHATDLFFQDMKASSPSGRYVLSAESPHNGPAFEGHWRGQAFQSDFVYTFKDTRQQRILWRRKQQEGSPVALFVSDDGWTVIRDAGDELVVVHPLGFDQGVVRLHDDVFTRQETKDYIMWSTAGRIWSGLSHWYFLTHQGQPYFVVRPWWGRHIIIQLKRGRVIEADEGLEKSIHAFECHRVLTTIKNKDLETWRLCAAAHLAGVYKLKAAIPDLKRLAARDVSDSFGISGDMHIRGYKLRQLAQLSLRRLGQTPAPHSGIIIERLRSWKKLRLNPKPKPRHEVMDQVKVGMKLEDVIWLIGSPDYMQFDTWIYDMDGAQPVTLEVKFDDGLKVIKVKRLKPLWLEVLGHERRFFKS